MTQENKELLLKDLCARLPHGVKVHVLCEIENLESEEEITLQFRNSTDLFKLIIQDSVIYEGYIIKPYLRPMSSMTEEEKKDILQSLNIHGDIDNDGNLLLGVECNIITLKVCKKYLGELNKRMFDVCHMIEKGLALQAPEGMYNIKEK